jgi:hypothetical protein
MTSVPRATIAALLAVIASVLPGAIAPVSAAVPTDGSSPAQARPASAGKVTFGIQPASVSSRDGRPAFSFGATPGGLFRDHVALVNYSDGPLTLRLVAKDAVNTDQGGVSALTDAQPDTDVGAWITTPRSSGSVVVPGRTRTGPGQVIVPFTLTVPRDATPGDHTGVLLAVLSTVSKNAQGTNVRLDQRVGTRVYLRISGALRPVLEVEGLTAAFRPSSNPAATGSAVLTLAVRNTGNVRLGGRVSVEVSGLLGQSVSTKDAALLPLVLPGSSVPLTLEVPGVYPELTETAKVTVLPVTVAGGTDPVIDVATASTTFWAVPWAPLGALVLVAVLLGLGWYLRHRRGGPPSEPLRQDPVRLGRKTATTLAATTATAAIALVVAGPAAAAGGAPFTDPLATSTITLCDRVSDKPFVWKAVGSAAPAAPFGAPQAVAQLYIFNPIKGTPPSFWSGEAMNGASAYADVARPASQSTTLDLPLSVFLSDYHLLWDGYLQLRLVYSRAGQGTAPQYAALPIRVTGRTWQVVGRPGTASCGGATAVSAEIAALSLPSSGVVTTGNPTAAHPSARAVTTGPPGTGGGSGAPAAGVTSRPGPVPVAVVADSASGEASGSRVLAAVLAALVVAAAAASGWLLGRHRP